MPKYSQKKRGGRRRSFERLVERRGHGVPRQRDERRERAAEILAGDFGVVKRNAIAPHHLRIGVSGDAGSFSEEAGILYANREGITPEIKYCIDMEGVLAALEHNEIDLGIFPVVNSRGGLVQTAFEAMGRHLFSLADEIWMEVQQCLLALPNIKREDITQIATHPQAISQCERYLKREFPTVQLIDWEDTAKAARDLHAGC